MMRYLMAALMVALSACTSITPSREDIAALKAQALAYPETRSDRVRVVALHGGADQPAGSTNEHYLAAFAHHIKVDAGLRSRLRQFEVSYHAPNRFQLPGVPIVPVTIPDRIEITRAGQMLVDEAIPGGFTGTQSYRSLEVAKLRVGGGDYLLVLANGYLSNPLWLGVFSAEGEALYRGGLPHGAVRFIENVDGIAFVDAAGIGKRVIFLLP
jgi:hypothetical protein